MAVIEEIIIVDEENALGPTGRAIGGFDAPNEKIKALGIIPSIRGLPVGIYTLNSTSGLWEEQGQIALDASVVKQYNFIEVCYQCGYQTSGDYRYWAYEHPTLGWAIRREKTTDSADVKFAVGTGTLDGAYDKDVDADWPSGTYQNHTYDFPSNLTWP